MMTIKQGLAGLLGVAALVIVIQQERLRSAQGRVIGAGVARDSLQASRDTTRLVGVTGVAAADDAVGGDSVRVWERRAVQQTERADALDHALAQERAARAEVRVASASMDTTVTMPMPGGEQVIRQAPYTLSIEAPAMGSPDRGGLLGVRVTADTLLLGVRIGCGAASRLGVRPASVSVIAPNWASVTLDHVEQEPSVCNAPAPAAANVSVIRRLLGRVGVTVGYSAFVTSGGVAMQPTVGVGVRVWP